MQQFHVVAAVFDEGEARQRDFANFTKFRAEKADGIFDRRCDFGVKPLEEIVARDPEAKICQRHVQRSRVIGNGRGGC